MSPIYRFRPTHHAFAGGSFVAYGGLRELFIVISPNIGIRAYTMLIRSTGFGLV
jgi:hypothetical protein